MVQVNVQEAKTALSALLRRVENGEEVTIARYGRPVAKLVAAGPPPPRPVGFVRGGIDQAFFDPLPEDELDAWQQ
jgi:prevent-host-death family protein